MTGAYAFMWVFMLACNLIVPVVMVCFGRKFAKDPPQTINSLYGYRTNRSMKNQDTWDFAHREIGKVWQGVGTALVPLAVVGQLLTLLAPDMEAMCMWSIPVTAVEIVVMVLSILPVERALKRNFDQYGNRK